MLNWWRAHAHNCFCTINARFFHLNILQGTQATCWFQKWKCPIFQWNIPQTLFWNDIYYMRENVKVKMLQKCIFELIYEQNHTSYILEHQERKEKIWKDTNINIYIYIYKCTTFLFQDSTGKHVYVQLEACTCSTEARACSTESMHMHNWSVYMLICRC